MFELKVPSDFSVVTDDDLTALETQAREAAAPLVKRHNDTSADKVELTPEERETLRGLADVVNKVKGEKTRRITAHAASVADAKSAAEAASVFAVADAPEAPVEPAPRAADIAPSAPPTAVGPATEGTQGTELAAKLVAPPNLTSFNAGHVFSDLDQVAVAAEAAFSLFPRNAAPGQFIRTPVMQLQRNKPAELTISESASAGDILRILDYAGSESRLESGSLVAAAGWCAPSQIDYGLFELETSDGMLDVPEIQINRGGIQFTTGPDFSTIFAGAGFWHQTEAQVQAATSKPTMVISCPSFTEKRLEVEGVAITGAFLQDRGYPEMVARFVRGALIAHARKMNIFKINQIISGSTLFDYTNTTNLPVTDPLYKDQTVISQMLAVLGTQVMDYRYKFRMAATATLECILPIWLIEVCRQDIQRRFGLDSDDAFNLTQDALNSWLAVRGVRAQWIYDWQDAYNATNTSIVGQSAGIYVFPQVVEAVLYAAGTWVAGVSPVVRLDTVYDSTNLALNQYAALFSEEGILMAKRGFESRRVKFRIIPSGAVGATRDMTNG